jgi:eukaryotic-like serine/threonine-protein kinase
MSIARGAKLGPYEVSGPLGKGGMGEVWRGWDPRLGREVALKILPEPAARDAAFLARFRAEAQAASALNHPNIVTIYDVGEEDGRPFLCMELLEGESLRELMDGPPIPVRRVLRIAAQVADGLAAAHARGIVHRDLKPENVVVTRGGVVKVLDFGLAKVSPLFGSRGDETVPAAAPSTSPGALLGTVGYMSPEQASGSEVDFRSDQFSLGTILLELLAGRRVWQRATAAETLVAIMKEEPPAASSLASAVPIPVLRIVERCLAKDPSDRYASTRDLALDLAGAAESPPFAVEETLRRGVGGSRRGISTQLAPAGRVALVVASLVAVGAVAWPWVRSGRSPIGSLAILPLENRGGESAEYLSDGITESLIDRLSRVSSLRVMARATVFRFKGASDPLDVGRKLGVAAILTGSVASRGSRLSVSVELVDVRTGERLWGDRYERPFEDVVRLQDAIAADIAAGLRLGLEPEERARLAGSGTESPEAYDLFLKARHHEERGTEEGYLEALRLFRLASEKDPAFARAALGVGDVYGVMAMDGYLRPEEAWGFAEAYSRKALAADPRLEAARAHLAVVRFFGKRDWDAVEELQRVFAARTWSNDVDRYVVGQSLMLWVTGRLDEASVLLGRARERDPGNLTLTLRLADCAAKGGRTDDALGLYREAVRSDPGDPRARFGLAEVLGRRGDVAGARVALQEAYELSDEDALARRLEGAQTAEELAGVRAEATREELARLERMKEERYVSPLDLGRLHAMLGERDAAFEQLEAAVAERSPGLVFLKVDDAWALIRDDPRFASLAARLGLP